MHLHEGDPCPYCRQDLDSAAIQIIQRYQSFLDSTAKEGLVKANSWGKKQIEDITALEVSILLDEEQFSEWCEKFNKEQLEIIKAKLKELAGIKSDIIKALTNWDKSLINEIKIQLVDWVSLEAKVEEDISALNEEKIKEKLAKINPELVKLKHRKILKGLLPEIKKFIDGLKLHAELEKLKKASSKTTLITNKATELHEKYISNRYVQLFKQECIDLNIPCPDLNPVGSKGKTKRKYSIVGEAPSKVLSEGEQRAVALADFFTEAQIGEMTGLIFDDPVNSQDYKRKHVIAKRIVAEARKRQIIILTHDLLFLNDLIWIAKEENVPVQSHWMEKLNSMQTGVIHPSTRPDLDSDFSDATIAKEKLREARTSSSPKEIIRLTREGLGTLRSSYESFIVNVVFDKVVKRFERRIRQEGLINIYAPKESMELISKRMGSLSGHINAHLQLDSLATDLTPIIEPLWPLSWP